MRAREVPEHPDSRARLADVGATGGAVAVLLEGEVVYLRGFGVRDVVSKAPVDAANQ